MLDPCGALPCVQCQSLSSPWRKYMRTKTEFTHSKTRVFLPFELTDPLAIHLPHLHRLNRYHFMTVYDLCIYNPCIIPCQITSGLPTPSGGSLHITFEMIGTTYSIIPALHFPKLPGIIFFNNNRYYHVLPCKKISEQKRLFGPPIRPLY